MSRQFTQDFKLEVPRGNISGMSSVNKFGRNDTIGTTTEDIWDGGGTWTAPTTARIHDIASSSASDTSGGVGARTIQVYGLTSWSANEVNETITLNGTTNVPTVNSYVIIHRMKVLTKGATDVNVGTITATAQTDSTITAQINPSEGQTQMAIYGIPSTQVAYMTRFYGSCNKKTSASINLTLRANPEPDTELTNFQVKQTVGGGTNGTSFIENCFNPYNKFSGPVILKMQGVSTTASTDISAGFDLILVNN